MVVYAPPTDEADHKKQNQSLQLIAGLVSARAAANPTGTIGLSAVNGVAATYVRSDAAPALSQAIAPTWTALHTYTLNSGGWTSSGSPNIAGSYLGPSQKFGIVANATALQAGPNQPETTMLVNMTTGAGLADPVNSYKTAFGATVTATNGAADVWAQSNVVNIQASNARGGVALELDLNNSSGISHGSTPTTPYVANLILAGQNTDGVSAHAYAHYALGIQFAQNSDPMWNYGIYMGPPGFTPFNTAAIFDESNSTYGYLLQGTKTTGIDMSSCTTSNAVFINNNSFVIGYNAARGATYTLLGVDTGNHICIGDGSSAYISSRQSINPSADNTYTLGIAGNRWNAVWAANGTIQTSDRRAKTDIESLPAALPIVMAVDPKTYRWKDGGGRHWGVIAQDLDAAIEKTGVEFAGINKDDPDHWGLNYAETNAILWKAVQELVARADSLESELQALKKMPWHGG